MGLLVAWRDGVSAAADGGAVVVTGPGARVRLRGLGPAVRAALRRLEPPGEDEDRLAGAAGTGYAAETSVGEFLLGSRRGGPAGGAR